jgi:hypothetical protein
VKLVMEVGGSLDCDVRRLVGLRSDRFWTLAVLAEVVSPDMLSRIDHDATVPYADSLLSGDGSGIKVPVVRSHTRLPPLSSELPITATITTTVQFAALFYARRRDHDPSPLPRQHLPIMMMMIH